ncbi:toxin-antitoxin system YwqK family antitoxin [Chondrinema litorale]|uniref:toxin-antitoxin system YwqK family antitoxin n=1 Tax=Chondrinema litorale TaxID=2994555 RepID=UPI002543A55F|nr:hypothetical protein [Chondrinema litorale]UZR98958.1 hypothetical protein OQ292_34475 [Chondrinema litorale]
MLSCTTRQTGSVQLDFTVDISAIPHDTIAFSNTELTYVNGKYLLRNKPYSGIVYKVLKGYSIKTYSSVLNGQLHGIYRSFYASGSPYEVRSYRNGLATGRHLGFWENTGNLKFEYNYFDQKKEGIQRNWYSTGDLAYSYSYKNDKLEGLQQAWRQNRSLYRNFIVKNGIRYGLQKSKTCYELYNEKVISQASKTAIKVNKN